jgi:hypothetical protein
MIHLTKKNITKKHLNKTRKIGGLGSATSSPINMAASPGITSNGRLSSGRLSSGRLSSGRLSSGRLSSGPKELETFTNNPPVLSPIIKPSEIIPLPTDDSRRHFNNCI